MKVTDKLVKSIKSKTDKYIPIVLNCLIIIFCMCVCIPLGYVKNYFHGNCVLYSEPSITVAESEGKSTISLVMKSSVWGEASTCHYTTFTPVVVAIYTFIGLWFHIQLKTSGEIWEGNLLCAMVISGVLCCIMFVVIFVTSCMLIVGTSHFCDSMKGSLNDRYTCDDLQNMLWSIYTDGRTHPFYNFLLLAQAGSWITVILLGIQIAYNFRKAFHLMEDRTDKKDEDHNSEENSDSSSDFETSYHNPAFNDETGSITFPHKMRKSSRRSDEAFLLPL